MICDILFGRRIRDKRGKPKDEFDVIINRIERFAPVRYRSERETYYYNYKIIRSYTKTLLPLLETLSRRERLKSDPSGFSRDLFLKLKDFYDPRDRLFPEEAVEDIGLIRKFRELYLFFYGTKDFPAAADMKE